MNNINSDKKIIYKYISFEAFVDMIQRQSILFSHPSRWEDKMEWIIIKDVLDNSDKKDTVSIIRGLVNNTFLSCWTRLQDSDALWKIYSKSNNAIRISTNIDNFHNLGLKTVDVLYSDDPIIDSKNSIYQLYAHKRTAYKYEEEVRVIKLKLDYNKKDISAYLARYLKDEIDVLSYVWSISSGNITVEKNSTEYKAYLDEILKIANSEFQKKYEYIHIDNINDFILGVLVSPYSDKWFEEMVELFCVSHNIKYLGKSTLFSNIP